MRARAGRSSSGPQAALFLLPLTPTACLLAAAALHAAAPALCAALLGRRLVNTVRGALPPAAPPAAPNRHLARVSTMPPAQHAPLASCPCCALRTDNPRAVHPTAASRWPRLPHRPLWPLGKPTTQHNTNKRLSSTAQRPFFTLPPLCPNPWRPGPPPLPSLLLLPMPPSFIPRCLLSAPLPSYSALPCRQAPPPAQHTTQRLLGSPPPHLSCVRPQRATTPLPSTSLQL